MEQRPGRPEIERQRDVLARLARTASLETSARTGEEIDLFAGLLWPGTRVFVAWVPGAPVEHAIEVSARLARIGLQPVPHIAARELPDAATAERVIARLTGEAGVTEALLIAGDRPQPAGPFADSVALLRTGLFEANGIRRLGVAAYPEGHARISVHALNGALAAKLGYAAAHGLQAALVTQFSFDGEIVLAWLRRLRAKGLDAPAHIGLAGPAKLSTLIKFGMRCGIGNSLRALSSHARQVTQLLSSQGPETVASPLLGAGPELGIAGWHLFSFGGFARTAAWLRSVAEGRIEFLEDGGFRVLPAA